MSEESRFSQIFYGFFTRLLRGGEVALIVALVGLQPQCVTQSTYAIVVFMTAVTTISALA